MEYLILSFLLGSIPTGYILVLLSGKGDIRKFGSKNIGATNVLRHSGKLFGLLTFLLDFFKGFIPVIYYIYFEPDIHMFPQTYMLMIGAATILITNEILAKDLNPFTINAFVNFFCFLVLALVIGINFDIDFF